MSKKRGIASILVATLLLASTVTGCTQNQGEGQTDEEQEKVTVTFGISDCTMEDGVHTEEFSVLKKLAEETGVELEFVNYDRDKFRTLAYSGDLPDMFMMPDSSMAPSLVQSGYVIGLNDLIEEYAPNVATEYADAISYETETLGDMYFFPYDIYDEEGEPYAMANGTEGFFARYDIYKAIGSPEITDSWDGFLDVLEEMQAYARDYYDDENIYAFSSWNDWQLWPYICVYPFTVGYGDMSDINYVVNAETGEYQNCFLDEDGIFWEGIEFLNDAYQRGLFDPEGLVQGYDQYTEKLQTGKTLVSFVGWLDPDETLLGEDACFTILPNSTGTMLKLTPTQMPIGNRLSLSVGISANCKNPEAIIKMYNWCNTTDGKRTLANGVQGETWDYVDGVPTIIGTYAEYVAEGKEDQYHDDYPTGIGGTHQFVLARNLTSDGEYGIADDGYPYDLMNLPENVASTCTTAERKFAEDYGCSYPGEVYMKWADEGLLSYTTTYLPLYAQLLDTPSDDVSVMENKAIQYFMGNAGEVILAESDEAFAKAKQSIIDEMIGFGLDETSTEVEANLEEAKTLAETFTFDK